MTRLERVAGLRVLEIVHVPGPGVMRIQAAIAKVEQSTLVVDPITSLHWGRVKGGSTEGPRRPRIAFATSRKGPQARLLAYTPRRETQPVLWQGIPVGGNARGVGVWGKDGQLTDAASASCAIATAAG